MAKPKLNLYGELSMDRLRDALQAQLTSGWIREMFRDYVIISRDEKLYRATYTIDGDDVTLGALDEVEVEYVPAMEMADFNSAWVEVFRAGDYGDKGEWTEDDIDTVVKNFSAGAWTPPAVIGHPKTDSPAMGWVKELQRKGKTLLAKFSQVQPELEELVSGGRFPNRSAAFYTDPQGKGPVLRHVGFLGATPPEVKGLAPVRFGDTVFTEFTFQEESPMPDNTDKKSIKEAVAEFFAELFGKKADAPAPAFSESQVTDIVSRAVTAATAPLIEANNQLTTQFGELKTQLSSSAADAKKKTVVAFVEKLKAAGRWVPAFDAMGVPALLEHTALSGGTVKFGEAGKEKEFGSYDALCAFLEQLPVIVPKGALTTGAKSHAGNVVKFNEAKGVSVDMQSVALNELAEKIAKDRKISFGEALPIAVQELSA